MQFDNDIPLPQAVEKREWKFGEMTCGQSFSVPMVNAQKARSAASAYKKRNPGWDYVTVEQADGQLRLWCKSLPTVVIKAVSPVYEPFYSTESTWAELEARQQREALEAKNKSET